MRNNSVFYNMDWKLQNLKQKERASTPTVDFKQRLNPEIVDLILFWDIETAITNSIPTSYQVDLIPLRTVLVVRRYLGITLINLAGAIEIIWQFFLKHTNNYDNDEINKIRPWSADSLGHFVSFSYFYIFTSKHTEIRWGF